MVWRFLTTKWMSWMTQPVIGTCFLITSVTITFYRKLRKLRYCERITSHWLRNITGVQNDAVMKFGDTQKLTESGSSENDSNIRYYCKTEELFDVFETALLNIGHKRTRGKRHCLVCDSQNLSLYLFLSKFLYLSFSHGSWTEKVLQRYSTIDRPLFGTLWPVSIEERHRNGD